MTPNQAPTLPTELVQLVFNVLDSNNDLILSLKDRARALAVCKHWRAALEAVGCALPVLQLTNSDSQGMWDWLVRTRPAVATLDCRVSKFGVMTSEGKLSHLREVIAACVQHAKVLLCTSDLLQVLPAPHLLAPRLEHVSDMRQGTAAWDPTWLASLARLPHLVHLQLALEDHPPPDQEWLSLPAFPTLTSLDLQAHVDDAGVRLGALPLLQCCTIIASRADIDASTAGLLPRLRDLYVLCTGQEEFTVDFANMPALQLAELHIEEGYMAGAATIAASTQLAGLAISFTYDDGFPDGGGWEVELLRALPPSVRHMNAFGVWDGSLAAQLGRKSHLVVLGLGFDSPTAELCPLPPPGAPLWSSLRALKLQGTSEMPLPLEQLRAATQLQLLQMDREQLRIEELELLPCLPALEQLYLPCMSLERNRAALSLLQRRMPNAQLFGSRSFFEISNFLQCAEQFAPR